MNEHVLGSWQHRLYTVWEEGRLEYRLPSMEWVPWTANESPPNFDSNPSRYREREDRATIRWHSTNKPPVGIASVLVLLSDGSIKGGTYEDIMGNYTDVKYWTPMPEFLYD